MSQTKLLHELEQLVEQNLNRHLNVAMEWFPHEYVPWSDGRDFDGVLGGDPGRPDDSPMSDVARSSLIVKVLTEDNRRATATRSRCCRAARGMGALCTAGPWRGRHGIGIRDYLLTSRAVDPVALDRLRST